MARKKKVNMDLNNDGVVDQKDKTIAAKVLRAKIVTTETDCKWCGYKNNTKLCPNCGKRE